MKPRVAGLALALIWGPVLAAQTLADPAKYLGTWTFSGDTEGTSSCTVQLKAPAVIGGYVVKAPKACAKVFAGAADIYAWRPAPGGAIAFADPTRHAVLMFQPSSDGDLVARGADGRGYVLDRPHPAFKPKGMAGAWRLNGLGGVALCPLTLTADKTGKAGALTRGTPCAAPWKTKAFTRWSLAGRKLTLKDAAGHAILSFKQDDLVTYEGEASSGDPIYLVRP